MAKARSYRSKIEVLRDFLNAAREPVPKTRLIGAANLNPLSFQKYLRVCTERGLIENVSGAFVATPRAGPLIEAIDGLILKTSELELAFRALEGDTRALGNSSGGIGHGLGPLIGRAWNEIVLRPVEPSCGPRSAAYVIPRADLLDPSVHESRPEAPQDPPVETSLLAAKQRCRPAGPRSQGSRARAPDSQSPRASDPGRSTPVRRHGKLPRLSVRVLAALPNVATARTFASSEGWRPRRRPSAINREQ